MNLSVTKAGMAVAEQTPEIASDGLNARLKNVTKAELTELRRPLRKFVND
ncbi:hypothetical protein LMG28614_05736 [Paraburkholderia ultramafica]|uniref:Uncharacterized protein n=1 Tax=Paraburkholderia ultramafica TaxID=1544867 RepID=A0A6S7BJZ8_9BURK|nr:hypothetical protein LMG28614_05736 [Paraburkholderia ultramafica]